MTPHVLSIVVANMGVAATMALLSIGLYRFQQRKLPKWVFPVPVVVIGVGFLFLLSRSAHGSWPWPATVRKVRTVQDRQGGCRCGIAAAAGACRGPQASLLAADDASALALWQAYTPLFVVLLGERAEALGQAVERFEFSQALEILRQHEAA